MGAILAVIGDSPEEILERRLQPMLERSGHRGDPLTLQVPGAILGIQTLGWDASMAQDEDFVVCFHGFIGNWDELETASLAFEPNASDAARVAQAYRLFGDRLFEQLRGEFSILVYHRADRTLAVVRDVLGTRPFYHQCHEGLTFLASEIRQVLAGSGTPPRINQTTCAAFLINSYYHLTDTLYEGVHRVAPAEIYRFHHGHKVPDRTPYWQLPDEPPRPTPGDYRELAEEARHHMERALRRHVPRDPFAFGLSGGLDSSALWSILGDWSLKGDTAFRRAHAYTMAFPGMSCDEETWVRQLETRYPGNYRFLDASGLSPGAFRAEITASLDHIANGSMYQLFWLAEQMQADFPYRHEIGGHGGDEIFGAPLGYLADELLAGHVFSATSDIFSVQMPFEKNYYSILRNHILKPCLQRLGLFPKAWRAPGWLGTRFRDVHAMIENRNSSPTYSTWSQQHFALILGDHQAGMILEPREQALSVHRMAPRSPLLDVDLIMFAHGLPPRARWQGVGYKALLRAAMEPVAPVAIIQRFAKTGFNEPYQREQGELAKQLTQSHTWLLAEMGIIKPAGVLDYFAPDLANGGTIRNACFVSRLLQAEFFCRNLGSV